MKRHQISVGLGQYIAIDLGELESKINEEITKTSIEYDDQDFLDTLNGHFTH